MKGNDTDSDYGDLVGIKSPRDTIIQIVLSIALGLAAFLAFCILRPRWPELYAARKKKRNQAAPLPDLPDSLFGWIPALWRISEQQVLASAGLDAYVFLRFFKMALKFLGVTLFFALVVFKPVHDAYPETSKKGNSTESASRSDLEGRSTVLMDSNTSSDVHAQGFYDHISTDYLWMYLIFAYLFSGLAIYLMVSETVRIIDIRQEYLGNQATITDRTIRLSGIPPDLRSEEKIKEFIEQLEIGKVDSVMLCQVWKELDDQVDKRAAILRKLEESWTIYDHQKATKGGGETSADSLDARIRPYTDEPSDEETGEQSGSEQNGSANGNPAVPWPHDRNRPKATVRYGPLKLRSRYVDAIELYEAQLQETDESIAELRKKSFQPTPLAFVTMDSVAACMAVQAVLDPSPMHLIASPAPAPVDVVWRNTYMPRWERMTRAWIITAVIAVLTVFWSLLLVPVAGVLQPRSLEKIFPRLSDYLDEHRTAESLVTTQLPTLVSTLLFVAIPYLYDWFANMQGIMSQGEVELSVISKNFFFSFFNYFVVFTTLGTLANAWQIFDRFQDSLKDTTWLANQLARSLSGLTSFYTNLIILQGIGLFPFRLLEFGSVFLYPFYRWSSKTPRDFAELREPPSFNYGFYLPQVLLIFIICIVYSVLRDSWEVILAGTIYFAIGGFVYKYQLLYAMDHRQHSTGRAWIMICKRMIVGLLVFQLTVAGQLALKKAVNRSAAMAPLIVGTAWFSYAYSRNYDPLMKFIALRSIERKAPITDDDDGEVDPDGWGETARLRYEAEAHNGPVVDESEQSGTRFINPSLVAPLEPPWLVNQEERENLTSRASSPRRRLTTTLNAL